MNQALGNRRRARESNDPAPGAYNLMRETDNERETEQSRATERNGQEAVIQSKGRGPLWSDNQENNFKENDI